MGHLLALSTEDGYVGILRCTSKAITPLTDNYQLHRGPVYTLAWADPIYGDILATGGSDGVVKLLIVDISEKSKGFLEIYSHQFNSAVNCIEFGSSKAGFVLAVGLESGNIAIIYKQFKNFEVYEKIAVESPISSLSWAPYTTPENLCSEDAQSESLRLHFITVSYDSQAIIWEYNSKKQDQITMVGPLPTPFQRGSIHSVAWCKNIGIPYDLIAIGCELNKVEIYTKLSGTDWRTSIIDSDLPVWHVGWSSIGCILSFHTSKNTKYAIETTDGIWELVLDY